MSNKQVKDICIRLMPKNETASVNISYASGTAIERVLPIQDVIEQLISIRNTNNFCNFPELGRMPYGYTTGKYKDNRNFSVILCIPATVMPVQYMGRLYRQIPFPPLIFAFKYVNGNLNTSIVRAGGPDSISYYPFGNVYDSGKICWGTYRHKEIDCISDSEKTAHTFYELPTNNDLWGRKYVNADVGVLSNMYDMLDGKDSFPEEWLVRCNETLDSLMKII